MNYAAIEGAALSHANAIIEQREGAVKLDVILTILASPIAGLDNRLPPPVRCGIRKPDGLIPILFISGSIKRWEVEPMPGGANPNRPVASSGFCQPSAAVAGDR